MLQCKVVIPRDIIQQQMHGLGPFIALNSCNSRQGVSIGNIVALTFIKENSWLDPVKQHHYNSNNV